MTVVLLIILALFHGEDGQKIKVVQAPSLAMCEYVKEGITADLIKQGASEVKVQCIEVKTDKVA